MLLPLSMNKTLTQISLLLRKLEVDWLVGGSCGLLLQGVDIGNQPRDLDIYVDTQGAMILYNALLPFATVPLAFNETEIYVSWLSHFLMEQVAIELVGGFEVKATDSHYKVDVSRLLTKYAITFHLNGGNSIKLMPLMHELIFNVLRNRPDRYLAIAETIRKQEENGKVNISLLNQLIELNTFSPQVMRLLNQLLTA